MINRGVKLQAELKRVELDLLGNVVFLKVKIV